jgi:hypothetical protein
MPTRSITADGVKWDVYPSGFITQYEHDEFGLIFVAGEGSERRERAPTGE